MGAVSNHQLELKHTSTVVKDFIQSLRESKTQYMISEREQILTTGSIASRVASDIKGTGKMPSRAKMDIRRAGIARRMKFVPFDMVTNQSLVMEWIYAEQVDYSWRSE